MSPLLTPKSMPLTVHCTVPSWCLKCTECFSDTNFNVCVCGFFLDSWISQSASFPRNQKQPGVDSLSPVASLPKQIFQPSAQQQPTKPVKVTCANCKKPLQKGQTAYQRKGSAHLFCSTTCLSSFSHKPAPKKLCVMCKK